MSATANPNFDVQQQAISSLRRIHQICIVLESMQVVGSILVLTMGYFIRPLHLYASMIYFFTAIFAHVVVYYVLLSIGSNVRDAHATNPKNVHEWLVFATSKLTAKIFPFILVHALILVALIGTAAAHGLAGLSGKSQAYHQLGAWCATIVGVACLVRTIFTLRENTVYLTSFVTSGGFSARNSEFVEH